MTNTMDIKVKWFEANLEAARKSRKNGTKQMKNQLKLVAHHGMKLT